MKIALNVSFFNQNKIFELSDVILNRDNCLYPFYMLKQRLLSKGIDISTSDISKPKNSDVAFFFDYNSKFNQDSFSKINYLFLFECDVISPYGWDKTIHEKFDKIFTWDDTLVDNVKYFKFNFVNLFPTELEFDEGKKPFNEKKFCCLIAGNKKIKHVDELYSKRVDAIKWFEKKHFNHFSLYGRGWDKLNTKSKYLNYFLRKIKIVDLLYQPFKSYKGEVLEKRNVLKDYKFSICFENAKNKNGYITEKIFDCFFSGVIPVYWGAPNIQEHIPKTCFIDFRDFDSFESLNDYLMSIKEEEYNNYIESIKQYLFSENAYQFTEKYLSDVIIREVVSDIQKNRL